MNRCGALIPKAYRPAGSEIRPTSRTTLAGEVRRWDGDHPDVGVRVAWRPLGSGTVDRIPSFSVVGVSITR